MKEFIELEKVKTRLLEQGIIEIIFKGGCSLEIEDIWQLREVNFNLSQNKPYSVLVMAEEFTSFSKEVRELLASRAFSGKTVAKAIIYEGVGQHMMASFYLHVNKPYIKTKIFSSRSKAIDWLRKEYLIQSKKTL